MNWRDKALYGGPAPTGKMKSAGSPVWTKAHTSSHVDAVSKDGNDLLVRFKDGATYRYADQHTHHDSMASAGSPGKYARMHLRAGVKQ